MKKIFTLLFVSIMMMQSCKKDSATPKNVELNATLAAGENYTLDLKKYGGEKASAKIIKQASNYNISEISSSSVYHYQSIAKTQITDQVVINVNKYRGSCDDDDDDDDDEDDDDEKESINITVNFTIR